MDVPPSWSYALPRTAVLLVFEGGSDTLRLSMVLEIYTCSF